MVEGIEEMTKRITRITCKPETKKYCTLGSVIHEQIPTIFQYCTANQLDCSENHSTRNIIMNHMC